MKETSFIRQNKDKWKKFEELNKQKDRNPDELSRLFVEITEDLSYARTFYPKRSVRVYLNYMAQNVFTSLYKIRKNPFSRFTEFWTTGLPLEMYRARWNLLWAFLITLVAALIGVVSTGNDINFARIILSDGYVEMTDSFIKEGDPMAVYKRMDEFEMFIMIFFNNIQVAFLCFILGIFFSVGTGFFLVTNGIMLGSFQSYFYFKGLSQGAVAGKQLLYTSFLTIWIHGAFEISAIVVAGAAGMTLGNGLLFPGTYTRMQSMQITAKRGIKIMVGLIPFFFIAAFFESWVTRQTDMPEFQKWGIILGSFGIFIAYFVLYPILVAKKFPERLQLNEEPLFRPERKINKYEIRQTNELFSDAFALYRMLLKFFIGPLFLVIVPLNIAFMSFLFYEHPSYFGSDLYWYEIIGGLYNMADFQNGILFACTLLLVLLNLVTVLHAFQFYFSKEKTGVWKSWAKYVVTKTWKLILPATLLISILSFAPGGIIFVCAFIVPVILFSLYPSINKPGNYIENVIKSIAMGFRSWSNGFLLFLTLSLIITCFFLMISGIAFASEIFTQIIEWHYTTGNDYWMVHNFIRGTIFILFIQFALPLYVIGFSLLYYTQLEKEESPGIRERLQNFGKKNKTFETESED